MRRNKGDLAKFLFCLSGLEAKVFQLFGRISEKVELPRVKFSLLYVAYDSLKNSEILLELAKSFNISEVRAQDYESILGEVWKTTGNLSDEILKLEKIKRKNIAVLADRLISVYALLIVLLKTLKFMSKEISEMYGADLDILEDIFDLVIEDEETDAQVLMSLKGIYVEKPATVEPRAPFVKYTNPDRWYMPGVASS